MRLIIAAARLPLRNDPAKSQFLRPRAHGRVWLSGSRMRLPRMPPPLRPGHVGLGGAAGLPILSNGTWRAVVAFVAEKSQELLANYDVIWREHGGDGVKARRLWGYQGKTAQMIQRLDSDIEYIKNCSSLAWPHHPRPVSPLPALTDRHAYGAASAPWSAAWRLFDT